MNPQGLQFLRWWQALAWLMVAAVIILSLMPKPPLPDSDEWPIDKLGHGLAYACQMWWFRQVFVARWIGVVFLLALGVALEWIQGMTAYRAFEYGDIVANCSGVFIGCLLMHTRCGSAVAYFDHVLSKFCQRC